MGTQIRTYLMKSDGSLEPFSGMPFDHYGTCPNIGDTVCFSWFRDRPQVYSVQRRYFIDNNDQQQGWALILREIEATQQVDTVRNAWYADDDWEAEIDAAEARERQQEHERLHERLALQLGKRPPEIELDHREDAAMQKLAKRGVGKHLVCRAIPNFGESTRNKLQTRGLISVVPSASGKFKDDQVTLTENGASLLKALKAYLKKVEAARAGS